MFNWFWKFLYSISKSLMQVCDWLVDVSLTLIGVEPMTIHGEETDFLTYLLTSKQVSNAFSACITLAIVAVVIFAVLQIIRTITKEEPGVTPGQICIKTCKCILMFLLVPGIMVALTYFLNTFMGAVYKATQQGATSIGAFLFTTFAQDAGLSEDEKIKFLAGVAGYNYAVTSDVSAHIEISDFNFIFSWIVSFVVMYNLVQSLVMFVDRAIAIVILYIAAPFMIASSVLDDGQRFKAWREQVLSKYLSAYGVIIALNIYIMVTGLVVSDGVYFFSKPILNYVAKILIVLGGAVTVRKSMTLVASLMSQGGAAEMNDPVTNAAGTAFANKIKAGVGKVASVAATPLKLGAAAAKGALMRRFPALRAASQFIKKGGIAGLQQALAQGGGLSSMMGTDGMNLADLFGGGAPSGAQNTNQSMYNQPQEQDLLRRALEGGNNPMNGNMMQGNPYAGLLNMAGNLLNNLNK